MARRSPARTPGDLESLPKLGVGLESQPALLPFIKQRPDTFDFVEVIPGLLWTDLGPGARPRFIDDPDSTSAMRAIARMKVVTCHSVGLSIGSANRFDTEHTDQIRRWHDWLRFPWHSDHLSYQRAASDDGEVNMRLMLPLPLDRATLDLLVPRVIEVRRRVPVAFLLENSVYYFAIPEMELGEPAFLNELCERSGAGLLLDLHNLYRFVKSMVPRCLASSLERRTSANRKEISTSAPLTSCWPRCPRHRRQRFGFLSHGLKADPK